VLALAQQVRVVFFDVDGVLTDGGLQFTETGESIKRFHTLDGHGIKLLQKAGITPAVVTGRDSQPLRLRLRQLGVEHAVFGTEDKVPAAQAILQTLGLDWKQAAAMGDDWPDLPVMRRCICACAPANAHIENLRVAHWVTPSQGGHGAVREWCDLLLHAGGHYARLLESYQR
jgi:3-deoxy-D-manno-octulosonate 8-phosphate phosphatase (KDO 8-P phosphatase)